MSDVAELFARDPMDLSEQDLDRIIARFREARNQFNNQALGSEGKKTAGPKDPEVRDLASKLDLDL